MVFSFFFLFSFYDLGGVGEENINLVFFFGEQQRFAERSLIRKSLFRESGSRRGGGQRTGSERVGVSQSDRLGIGVVILLTWLQSGQVLFFFLEGGWSGSICINVWDVELEFFVLGQRQGQSGREGFFLGSLNRVLGRKVFFF